MRIEKWHIIAIGVLFLILAGLIFLTVDLRSVVSLPELAVREVLAPVQGAMSAASQAVARWYDALRSLRELPEENRTLRDRVAALEAELRAAEHLRRENERLRALLDLDQRIEQPSVAARVIARSPENWFGTVTINRGSRAGLVPGLPVINEDGVVGHVANVTPNTAHVVLLVDAQSAVGGVVEASRTPVLVEGISDPGGRTLRVRPLIRGGEMRAGLEVVTGGSSIFPDGIPIGVIAEVRDDPSGMNLEGTLIPYVDFGRLEWLMVLLEADGEVEWRGPERSAAGDAAASEGVP